MKKHRFTNIVCFLMTVALVSVLFSTTALAKTQRDIEKIEDAAQSLESMMNQAGFDAECFYSEKSDTFYCGYTIAEIESAQERKKYSNSQTRETETELLQSLYEMSKNALKRAGFDGDVTIMCFTRAKNNDILFVAIDGVNMTNLLSD